MKTALVTGASRGLGAELTKELRALGWLVYATSKDPILNQVVQMDVTDRLSIQRVKVLMDLEGLDLLINNAGIFPEKDPILKAKENSLLDFLAVNTFGPLMVTQEFWEHLKHNQGKVINISSSRGVCHPGNCERANYSISKNALNHITRLFSIQGKSDGVQVNAICPGHFRSDMGGEHAPQSVQEAANHVLWLANQNVSGHFFNARTISEW